MSGARRCGEGARTEIVGTPFLREASTDLDADSGSSLSLLSSAAGESRSAVDREDWKRKGERETNIVKKKKNPNCYGLIKTSTKSSMDSGTDVNAN